MHKHLRRRCHKNWFGWDGGQWKEDSALCLSERLGGGIMTDTGNMGNKL